MLQNKLRPVKIGLIVIIITLVLAIGTIAMTPVKTLAQVTSIEQLSDVKTTDYYYQALKSLVERYGCFAGFPDATFRANKDLTRYELAGQMNACLDRMDELNTSFTADGVTKEQVVILKNLINELQQEVELIRRSRQSG